MKAMLLTAPGELVRDDVTRPGPEQGQLLVRVTHSGICGTDYKIFNGAIPVKYPRIMGHEMAGEVVDAGASALRTHIGVAYTANRSPNLRDRTAPTAGDRCPPVPVPWPCSANGQPSLRRPSWRASGSRRRRRPRTCWWASR